MRAALLFVSALTACTAVESSGGMLPPTSPPQGPSVPVTTDAPASAADVFDEAAGLEPVDAPADAEAVPDDAFGTLDTDEPTADAPTADVVPETDAALMAPAMGLTPPSSAPPATSAWSPERAGPLDWGVRLVSTLPDTQPPRAVLALGQGGEIVVQPGSFVEAARIVVLAIGRDAIQVAHVEPEGDHTRVTTEILRPFYGHGASTTAPM